MTYGTPAWADWVLKEEESIPHFKAAWEAGINTWGELLPPTRLELLSDQFLLPVLTPLCSTDTANVVGYLFRPHLVVAETPGLSLFSKASGASAKLGIGC